MLLGYIKQKLRKTKRIFRPKNIILMYHRVAEVENDPWELSVKPDYFKEHLQVLSRFDEVLTLRNLSEKVINQRSRKKAIALTFDDGYRDNLYVAKKWLETFKIPATFFIASGYTGIKREFWWDELERLLLAPGRLPQKFQLNEMQLEWELGTDAVMTNEEYKKYQSWTTDNNPPTKRHGLYLAVWQVLREYSHEKQLKVMDQISEWSGNGDEKRENYPMTKEELTKLSRSEFIEIGAHTYYHPSLPAIPQAAQMNEIFEGKKALEAWLNKQIKTFSYPYGNYSMKTINLVKDAGFDFAYTSQPGMAGKKQTRFTLPRFQVKNWNGREFEHKLSQWLERY